MKTSPIPKSYNPVKRRFVGNKEVRLKRMVASVMRQIETLDRTLSVMEEIIES